MNTPTSDLDVRAQRQVLYWRLLAACFGQGDRAPNIEEMTGEVADRLDLPRLLTDPHPAVDTLIQRFPELKGEFEGLEAALAGEDHGAPDETTLTDADLRRDLLYSKLLLNVLGPNTLGGTISAEQFNRWCRDVGRFEACFGRQPGALRGRGAGDPGGQGADTSRPGVEGGVSGRGPQIGDEQLHESLAALEGDLIRRMALRELLEDDALLGPAHAIDGAGGAIAPGQGKSLGQGPGQRATDHPELRRSARGGPQDSGPAGGQGPHRPLDPAQASLPQPRPEADDLEEPDPLQSGRPAGSTSIGSSTDGPPRRSRPSG